jgi:hypothetical protein
MNGATFNNDFACRFNPTVTDLMTDEDIAVAKDCDLVKKTGVQITVADNSANIFASHTGHLNGATRFKVTSTDRPSQCCKMIR